MNKLPERKTKNADVLTGIVAAGIVLVVYALIRSYIDENPWTRWFVFAVAVAAIVFSTRQIIKVFRNQMLNRSAVVYIFVVIASFLIATIQISYFFEWLGAL